MNMVKQTEAESAKALGATTGAFAGGCMGAVFVIVGVLLCFTVIGAIIGIPLILIGVGSPIMGSLVGLGSIKGPCPWCGGVVVTPLRSHGVDCPSCKKRVVVRGKQFVALDS
jgi:DNA-directed RNA polymerase subunit RPC12/RpoP